MSLTIKNLVYLLYRGPSGPLYSRYIRFKNKSKNYIFTKDKNTRSAKPALTVAITKSGKSFPDLPIMGISNEVNLYEREYPNNVAGKVDIISSVKC